MKIIGTLKFEGETLSITEEPGRFHTKSYSLIAEDGEPFTDLSKEPFGSGIDALADNEVQMKMYAENEQLREPLLATGLFEDTGRRVPAGYAELEVWRRIA